MTDSMIDALRATKRKLLEIKYRKFENFIFIHINKTGGSSIEKALNLPFEHKTALDKRREVGKNDWDRKLTFTVVRNPWDKAVSHYHSRLKRNHVSLRDNPIDFREWVKRSYGDNDKFYYDKPKMFMPQINWITDKKGNIIVDEIIYFENLENEFNDVLKKLGKNTTLPHVNKSEHRNYREYYDEQSADVIQNWFKQDIKRLGFRF